MFQRICRLFLMIVSLVAAMGIFLVPPAAAVEQVPALMDLRTTFSDGAYDPETLVKMAVKKGFRVIFINDHDRMVMEYGLPPFRNIIKKREERNSIEQSGVHTYLQAIASIRKANPDVILIPGAESAPFYYWTGSLFDGSLTANDHEQRILTMGLERLEDYQTLPGQHNDFSTIDLRAALPVLAAFGGAFLIALYFLFLPGWWRLSGAVLALVSAAFFTNVVLARPSPFDAYHGNQGAAPYQHFIDTVSRMGGLTFWNYPETRSGVRTLGPIRVKTLPYPEMLLETKNYTGFSALYGDTITITEPGNIWDMTLQQYCRGFRARPPWGIATADFHREGEDGQRLGDYQTVLLLSERSSQGVLAALKGGKMYARQGKFPKVPSLDEFSVAAAKPDAAPRVIAGDELLVDRNPRIRITVSGSPEEKGAVQVRLIRSGTLIQTFKGTLPLRIDYTDTLEKPGEKIYYRMDMAGQGAIVSNPIFVTFTKK
ncbi:MAG: PHP domain-containing protein [Syntrophales bacterium]